MSKDNIKIKIPAGAKTIIDILEKNGFEAYVVGGCVRDSILGREPGDWDITTSALPMQVKKIFYRTVDTGIQHGTVTVLIKGVGYEVTTYRIDGDYTDGRHPESVKFTASLTEDLKRRDFTVNAMAYNPKTGLVDIYGGIDHLMRKIICCVGNAKERFSEDALRILRAVRFSAQLGFSIDEETEAAMKEMAFTLSKISAERIRNELEKLILSPNPDKLIKAYELGITQVVLPEFDRMMECEQNTPYHMYNVGEHTVKVMENVPKTRVMEWAALLHDVAKPDVVRIDEKNKRTHFKGHASAGSEKASKIMRRLKLDNKTIKTVTRLIECHDDRPVSQAHTPEAVRRSVHKIGKDIYQEYLALVYADLQGKSKYGRQEGYDDYVYMSEQFDYIVEHHVCTSLEELNIKGRDLIELRCPKGAVIGDVLNQLLDGVLTNSEDNTNDVLRERAEEIIKKLQKL